jgi:N-acetylmuramoyl-L-alanine amidase
VLGPLAVVLSACLLMVSTPAPVKAANGAISDVSVSGSPFYPNGDGIREKATFAVRLNQAALLKIFVLDFDGQRLRTLLAGEQRAAGLHSFKWNGRNSAGLRVDDGPYRFRAVAEAGAGAASAEAWVTKARKIIYPARQDAIVIAIDPGHGDVYSEAGRYAPDGTHESVINLDIGLRLNAMLRGAGVRTAITRTTATGANTPEWDRNEDGDVGYADELAARTDAANIDRADLYISIHNNLADNTRVGGPSAYYRQDRTFASESYRLAQAVYSNMLARLDLYRTDTWKPSRSHGILSHQAYYVLSPYSLPLRPRPSLMPGVLSEGLFLTNPYELTLLKRPDVRQSMATAYYDAAVAFVRGRKLAADYKAVTAPPTASPGQDLAYTVRLTNKGMADAVGWKLQARRAPAVLLYDGSDVRGQLLASASVPTLGRGGRAKVSLTFKAPPAGDWLVKFDIVTADGRYLSDSGVVKLQLPLSVR